MSIPHTDEVLAAVGSSESVWVCPHCNSIEAVKIDAGQIVDVPPLCQAVLDPSKVPDDFCLHEMRRGVRVITDTVYAAS